MHELDQKQYIHTSELEIAVPDSLATKLQIEILDSSTEMT